MMQPVPQGLSQATRWIGLICVVAAVVLVDQLTKVYATTHWKDQPPLIYLNDLFRIQYAVNTGAFLSLLAGNPAATFWVLTVLNSVMLLAVTWYLLKSERLTWLMFLPWALILAGGIGNLIDRIRFGHVIDFMNLGIGSLRTGIFNVADIAITAGFLFFLPIMFRSEPKPEDPKSAAAPASAPVTTST
ncbi:signal peptidase II [Planctomicrobium sp. SH664]|uniref:signal peptidase II n=1 Tax=Planctomicrobium sp. SH664 TaxID=3448125 RepID=UPI003F5C6384